jgi:hypothetical protein
VVGAAIASVMWIGASAPVHAAPAAESAAAATLSKVEPAEYGAGATITITGTGFQEGDVVLLDSVALADVKITPTQISATVPAKAKSGKALILRRGKTKLATIEQAGAFAAAPKLTSAAPKFAAPGEAVTLKGKGLDRVKALTIAGETVKIDEQTATSLKFTAPSGKTGPLVVKGAGGEAALKKDYEIFYAPALAAAEPSAGFEGDSVVLKGAHLEAAKFKLGKKPLKASEQAEAQAKVTIAKGAKTGPLRAEARKKGSEVQFTVHPTPALTSVPKEVGAPGSLKVSGKNLDAVTTWRLGQVQLTPEAPASATKVTLALPDDAPGDQPLVAVSQGREFASKKPVVVLRTPVVDALAFWPGPEGKGVEGEIRGRELSSATKFTLGGKPLKTTFVDATRVTFALPAAPKPAEIELSAKTGKYKGPAIAVDGAGGGYSLAAGKIDAVLGGEGYAAGAIALDLEVGERQPGRGAEALKAAGRAASSPEGQATLAATGKQIALDLRRFSAAQAALCRAMTAGKTKEQADANAALGEQLRASGRRLGDLAGQLKELWSDVPLAGTEAAAAGGLAEVDAEVAAAIAARAKVDAACKGKFVGSGKLTSDAAQVAKVDLEGPYKAAILAVFTKVLAKGKTWPAVEADVSARLQPFAGARRTFWQGVLKASKQAVEAKPASTPTGKGATGDKHVDPKGKPKGGKGKAN